VKLKGEFFFQIHFQHRRQLVPKDFEFNLMADAFPSDTYLMAATILRDA
jgi:hypothetical protein